jgi:hypothetical protein
MKKIGISVFATILLIILVVTIKITTIGKPIEKYDFGNYLLKSDYDTSKNVQLTFLGTSGFVFNYKNKKLITDPYFSNPSLLKTTFSKIPYPLLPENLLDRSIYKNAATMVISHGHYDHCLDIENFLTAGSEPVKIIAEQHIVNEIYSIKNKYNVDFETDMSGFHYSYDSTFRILPLHCTHSPHVAGITLFQGNYTEPLAQFPEKLWKWKLHNDYSYMIDIMEDNEVKFRCLFMCGNVAEESVERIKKECADRKADVMLQIFWKEKECLPSLNKVYAAGQPKQVILHHWNNFFKKYDGDLQVLRGAHLDKVLKNLNAEGIPTEIILPFSSISL